MERDIIQELKAWRDSPRRKPLMLKGARQVGKTWALKEFGAQSYENVAYVSLENIAPGVPSEYAQLFERSNDPRRIVRNLSLALGTDIAPSKTLLILDEKCEASHFSSISSTPAKQQPNVSVSTAHAHSWLTSQPTWILMRASNAAGRVPKTKGTTHGLTIQGEYTSWLNAS